MKLSAFQRRAILAGALVATVAAALMPEEPDAPPLHRAPAAWTSRQTVSSAGGAGEPLPQLAIERLAQAPSREGVLDAFETRSWLPPPAKQAPLPPPPPPQAPPLPFKYLGKIMDGGQVVVFLAKQDNNYMVRAGDKLDNNYQVDEIKPGMMTLTYLPLGQKQTLAIGAVN